MHDFLFSLPLYTTLYVLHLPTLIKVHYFSMNIACPFWFVLKVLLYYFELILI